MGREPRGAPRSRQPRGEIGSTRFSEAASMAARLPPARRWPDVLETSSGRPFPGEVTRFALMSVDLVIGKLDVLTVSRGATAADRIDELISRSGDLRSTFVLEEMLDDFGPGQL